MLDLCWIDYNLPLQKNLFRTNEEREVVENSTPIKKQKQKNNSTFMLIIRFWFLIILKYITVEAVN